MQVLLVDDDALVLGVLTGILETLGHAVVSAANAPDAEQFLGREYRPGWKLA